MATHFQQQVWAALSRIPPGYVTTYGEIARFLGTKAVRAVGTAVGNNPDAPTVPCHRVVRSDGTVGRYSGAGGTPAKIALLEQEEVRIEGDRVADWAQRMWYFGGQPSQSTTSPSGS